MGVISPRGVPQFPVMPDFAQGTAGFAHTLDSAVQVLDSLDVSESRLTLRMAGPGGRALRIVRQSPAPGTSLTPSTTITLWICGLGFFDSLPFPMRESGGEAEFGTRELCRLFDDPLQKAAQWLRAGAPLFRIGRDKVAACRRWLALFGIEASAWPEQMLYPLALLAPTLSTLAGRETGIRMAFLVLLGLPVHRFVYREAFRYLARQDCSRLGAASSRLGCNLVAGDRQSDLRSVIVLLGPVSLDIYDSFQSESRRRLIQMTADLCMSAYQDHSFRWQLDDVTRAPRLGIAASNSRIGLNFHLGKGDGA
jgi:hypothetical protein